MEYYKNINKCRICGSEKLDEVMYFKPQYLHSLFVKNNSNHPLKDVKIPMTVLMCEECSVVQLRETVNPDLMYFNYFYRTGINFTMKNDLQDVVRKSLKLVNINEGDLILDVGCNDAYMIQLFPDCVCKIGLDPAKNINWENVDKSITIINDYFSEGAVRKVIGDKKIKILTCTAVFYDIPDTNKAVRDIKNLLSDDGVAVIQVSSLLATIKNNNWQDFTFEHLMYYSLHSISNLMERNGLRVFSAEENFVNGGSIRVYIRHQKNDFRTNKYFKMLREEEKYEINNPNTFKNLQKKIELESQKIYNIVKEEIENGGKVIALAASTKGNVILQTCGLENLISFISDRNKEKVGLYTLGTNIKLISEEEARKMNPSLIVVLTFHFKEEIINREYKYLKNGGKLLFLAPFIHCVDEKGEHIL